MEFQGYHTLSSKVKEQLKAFTDIWINSLQESLIGIYLHGSIALNCFVEGTSDIDILIISNRRIDREERLLIAKQIIEIDKKPSHLELSAIWIEDLKPWKYPTPCQFHYSDTWTERYKSLLDGSLDKNFIVDEDFCDADIACHVQLTNQSGICIYGNPVKEVFPAIPEEDFWNSISSDIEDYDFKAYDPRYFASNILILGRILSYKKEKRILSKYEGGLWTMNYVPKRFQYLIDHAIREWYQSEMGLEYKQEDLEDLRHLLVNEIQK